MCSLYKLKKFLNLVMQEKSMVCHKWALATVTDTFRWNLNCFTTSGSTQFHCSHNTLLRPCCDPVGCAFLCVNCMKTGYIPRCRKSSWRSLFHQSGNILVHECWLVWAYQKRNSFKKCRANVAKLHKTINTNKLFYMAA